MEWYRHSFLLILYQGHQKWYQSGGENLLILLTLGVSIYAGNYNK